KAKRRKPKQILKARALSPAQRSRYWKRFGVSSFKEYARKSTIEVLKKNSCPKCGKVKVNSYMMSLAAACYGGKCKCNFKN
ncbi:MAG: hypothetical protein Q7K42_02785, partial [Candidatus Diapherotrites archaeon]|nr:hypothetical protein [Candidatus Diapherotrites archaeon]